MTVSIKPVDPVNRAFFAGEVSGIDLRKPLTKDEVAAVHAGMDQFGVLVFHDQDITDDQQLVFSRSLGPLEQATGDISAPQDRRMSMDLNDISNLDKHNKVLARDDRRRLFGLGNMLWHSDSSFKPVPAKYSLLSARTIPPTGGNTEFADMRAAYDALAATITPRCATCAAPPSPTKSRASNRRRDATVSPSEAEGPLFRRHKTGPSTSLRSARDDGDRY